MKKQILKTVVLLCAVISLSGCANTIQGIGQDVSSVGSGIANTARDTQDWSHGKETELGEKIGEVPRGYAQPHYYKGRKLTGGIPLGGMEQETKREYIANTSNTNTQADYSAPSPAAVRQEPLPKVSSAPASQMTWKSAPPVVSDLPPAAAKSQRHGGWDGAPLPLQPRAASRPDGVESTGMAAPAQSSSGVTVNYDVLDNSGGVNGYAPPAPEPPVIRYAPGVMVYPVDPNGWQHPVGEEPVSSNDAGMPQFVVSSEGTSQYDYQMASAAGRWGYSDIPRETIFFNHGSARLGSGDKTALKNLANEVTGDSVYMVQVIGHASNRVAPGIDPVKQSSINLQMSMLRAQAVATQLYKDGLEPELVEAAGRGDTQPNHNPPGGMSQEAANRRVEVFVSR